MTKNIRLAILASTGMAGREALLHQELLDNIGQYAELTCVTASPGSAGRKLGDIFDEKELTLSQSYNFWKSQKCPESLRDLVIDETNPDIIAEKADYAISALGSDIAKTIEPELTKRGIHVFSNASSFRWDPKVPLLIPEVNYKDIEMLESQKNPGKHICNPNCTTAGYTPFIKALEDLGYKVNNLTLVTEQAISGKGDAIADSGYISKINGNVIDDWTKDGYNSEEWKSACEPMKILGRIETKEEVMAEKEKALKGEPTKIIPIHTQTTRVPTQYGHLEYLSIEFDGKADIEKIKKQLSGYTLPEEVASLPTTPKQLFVVLDKMPEPKKDVYKGNGMVVVVGDVQQHTPLKISLWTLTHNLRRGATWAGRQGLELYLRAYKGMFR